MQKVGQIKLNIGKLEMPGMHVRKGAAIAHNHWPI